MKSFKIGKVYSFAYDSQSGKPSTPIEDPIYCRMSEAESKKLEEELLYSADKRKADFEDRKSRYAIIFKMAKELDRMKKKRQAKEIRQKDAEEVNLERKLTALKNIYFRKEKPEQLPYIKARSLFYRQGAKEKRDSHIRPVCRKKDRRQRQD